MAAASTPATAAPLRELWRTEIPGDVANVYLADPASNSLFAGDGWGVSYAALRLHRLRLDSGEHLADVRTRHQGASALAIHQQLLYAATDSRLFELRPADLAIVRQWDRGLVRYSMQLVAEGSTIVSANWHKPTIGLFDLDSGRTRRVMTGLQPLVFRHGADVKVLTGYDGGMWTLDIQHSRLTAFEKTPAIANLAVGQHIWATVAGHREGGQGEPAVWAKRGTNVITRLTGSSWAGRAGARVARMYCDDRRGVLWCLVDGLPGMHLQAVSQSTGAVLRSYEPPRGPGVGFCYVDVAAGVALHADAHHVTRGNVLVSSTSRVVCFALPDDLP
ncbi:MAG TPA: hypothetical protein VG104_00545 [Candidatus Dormibacteraeota bacterium]|nr:hypothetical protein [Candidatus Dormibacteraeota bacterium]